MKKLIAGEYYTIKHTGHFCHCVGSKGFVEFSKGMNSEDVVIVQFVGTIKAGLNYPRNVFYDASSDERKYYLFDAEIVDYVI